MTRARTHAVNSTAPALRGGALTLLAACMFALGCADNLPKATEIIHMRVLGAKIEVVGDETRSTPRPGEQVNVTFDTVFPTQKSASKSSQMLVINCTAPTRYTGGIAVCQEFLDAAKMSQGEGIRQALAMANGKTTLRCADLPGPHIEAGGVGLTCLAGSPKLSFKVDKNFSAARMLFIGVLCERGTPLIDVEDPALFSCEHDNGETLRLNGLIPIEHKKADENHNPSLSDLTVVLDPYTKPWLLPIGDLPADKNCRAAEQPSQSVPLTLPYADPGTHKLLLSYDATAREKTGGDPEDLELSIYTTGGQMERRFTLWSSTDPTKHGKLEASLDWDPPPIDDLPAGGQLVRFFLTLRDQRGGFDFAERAACVH